MYRAPRARPPALWRYSINLSFARMILSDVLHCTVPPLRAELFPIKPRYSSKSLHQYGRMADTTAAQPAALQRRMAAMKVEQEKERERLEDARRRAQ